MRLAPPIEPMLARPLGQSIPSDAGIWFEPKWDGFRCIVFRGNDGVVLQGRGRSRSGAGYVDLGYAFPEVVSEVAGQIPAGTVLDGELVVPSAGRLDFDLLSARLRPRSEAGGANIDRLASATPARLLVFDLLEHADRVVVDEPFARRRSALVELAATWHAPIALTPGTEDRAIAATWFGEFEAAGVDGLIVKPLADRYQPGVRAQGKVKHRRSADVVLAGWRPHVRSAAGQQAAVGSLLLGLYDDDAKLHYVGACSAFTAARRRELAEDLIPVTLDPHAAHPWRHVDSDVSVPGGGSRWRDEQPWFAVSPQRVVEVTYEQMAGRRFRHLAGFVRWREDRDPASCRFDQLEVPAPADIGDLLDAAD